MIWIELGKKPSGKGYSLIKRTGEFTYLGKAFIDAIDYGDGLRIAH